MQKKKSYKHHKFKPRKFSATRKVYGRNERLVQDVIRTIVWNLDTTIPRRQVFHTFAMNEWLNGWCHKRQERF